MSFSLLVVDDDDDDFMLLSGYIKQGHHDVALAYASNGLEATQHLSDGLCPNLLLVDVQMPLMNGYELLVWLMASESWRHIPVVIWTGEMEDREVTRFYRAGANSVMLKQTALNGIDSFCEHWLKLVQLPQLVWEAKQ